MTLHDGSRRLTVITLKKSCVPFSHPQTCVSKSLDQHTPDPFDFFPLISLTPLISSFFIFLILFFVKKYSRWREYSHQHRFRSLELAHEQHLLLQGQCPQAILRQIPELGHLCFSSPSSKRE